MVDRAPAPPPEPVADSAWALSDPDDADASGLVGFGADLAVETLVDAYRHGIFPWPHPDVPLPWFSPDPRGVLLPDSVHVSRSLDRTLRRCGWVTTVDAAFDEVVKACAGGRGVDGTWITPPMAEAYRRLHERGWAHSLEVWAPGPRGRSSGQVGDNGADELVGGIYGVRVGAVFTGESMFHRATDGSKVAVVDLARRWSDAGGDLIDVQMATDHLRTLGVVEVARRDYLDRLEVARDRVVRMETARLPVARLSRRPGPAASPGP